MCRPRTTSDRLTAGDVEMSPGAVENPYPLLVLLQPVYPTLWPVRTMLLYHQNLYFSASIVSTLSIQASLCEFLCYFTSSSPALSREHTSSYLPTPHDAKVAVLPMHCPSLPFLMRVVLLLCFELFLSVTPASTYLFLGILSAIRLLPHGDAASHHCLHLLTGHLPTSAYSALPSANHFFIFRFSVAHPSHLSRLHVLLASRPPCWCS